MRRRIGLVLLGVLAAFVGGASAHASGVGAATTTGTTTTGTTPTTTTTTTPTPSYGPLGASSLPAGCVGAGAAALVPLSHSVVAIGTPASNLGPSGYPGSAAVVAFSSSSVVGAGCSGTKLILSSVSLFEGAVTAGTVEETDGRGTVAGLEIAGAPVSAATGQTVPVGSWAQLTLGEKVGRLTAPLVLRLLQARDGLLAGTRIAIAFSATRQPAVKTREKHRSSANTHPSQEASARATRHTKRVGTKKTHRREQPSKPALDFPTASDPMFDGRLTLAAQQNAVVSAAARYLGVPYRWGGASPKTGFDCSGLVTYVFGQLGVALPHYAAAQYYSPDAVWVSPKRLQAGDLVFFTGSDGTRKMPGHVGIYVGDGYLIDAPHTGSFVRVDSLDERWFAQKFVAAKRIVAPLQAARRLSRLANTRSSATGFRPDFLSPMTITPLGERLGLASAGTAVGRTPSRSYTIWIAVLGGLLLSLLGGGVLARRRRAA